MVDVTAKASTLRRAVAREMVLTDIRLITREGGKSGASVGREPML